MHNIREKMQKSGKLTNIVIENTAEVVNENGINVDPINIYAKTQHVFAEVLLLTFLFELLLMTIIFLSGPGDVIVRHSYISHSLPH